MAVIDQILAGYEAAEWALRAGKGVQRQNHRGPRRPAQDAFGYCRLILVTSDAQAGALNARVPPSLTPGTVSSRARAYASVCNRPWMTPGDHARSDNALSPCSADRSRAVVPRADFRRV
jgi:hypothetical protein